jgi:hypothetical protein
VTLAEIRVAFPGLFYGHGHPDEWFRDQPFMQKEPVQMSDNFWTATVPSTVPVSAADLAALYVRDPDESRWRKFLWTDDIDTYDNRVYVAGVGQYGIESFQIHRHLAIPPDAWWVWQL